MKKIMFAIILISSQLAQAKNKLEFSGSTPEQFTYEIADEGMVLSIKEVKTGRKTDVKQKYTISDAQKMTIIPDGKGQLKQPLEMLLVVLSYGNMIQNVQVYIPGQTDSLIQSSQTHPVCIFQNFGDFSWESPEELKSRIQLVDRKGESELQIKIGAVKGLSSVQTKTKKCFSIK